MALLNHKKFDLTYTSLFENNYFSLRKQFQLLQNVRI